MGCHDDYSLARPADFHVRRDVVDYGVWKWRRANFGPGDILREIR
jgi:hypothetical protein